MTRRDIEAHRWTCIGDGQDWFATEHLRKLSLTGGIWRGHPAAIDGWDQWVRENLPHAHNGVTYASDDGYLRSFDSANRSDLGLFASVEAKSHWTPDSRIPHKDIQTARAMLAGGRILPALFVCFDGDVPTNLYHWPRACPSCDGPVRPRSSSRITVYVVGAKTTDRKVLRPDELRGYLMRYMQHPEP
jgi:hypothetical protein